MFFKLKKDKFFRQQCLSLDLEVTFFQTILKHSFFSKTLRLMIFFYYCQVKNFYVFTKIRNFCLITGRSRSVLSFFRLFRFQVRQFIRAGFLPGIIQSSW